MFLKTLFCTFKIRFIFICVWKPHACIGLPAEARSGCWILWGWVAGSCKRPSVDTRDWTLIFWKCSRYHRAPSLAPCFAFSISRLKCWAIPFLVHIQGTYVAALVDSLSSWQSWLRCGWWVQEAAAVRGMGQGERKVPGIWTLKSFVVLDVCSCPVCHRITDTTKSCSILYTLDLLFLWCEPFSLRMSGSVHPLLGGQWSPGTAYLDGYQLGNPCFGYPVILKIWEQGVSCLDKWRWFSEPSGWKFFSNYRHQIILFIESGQLIIETRALPMLYPQLPPHLVFEIGSR